MKDITKTEFKALGVNGKGAATQFYNKIFSLEIGKGVIIYKSEWRPKYPPTRLAMKIEKKYGYKYERGSLPDRTGWAFIRIS